MTTKFKDHFSENSAAYCTYRPNYPEKLFLYLSSITQNNKRAWDCATGSGQSALALSRIFPEVIATDASQNQIDSAVARDGIDYRVEKAEKTSIESNSVDLITVAQALHWFNIDKFTNEVSRVLKKKAVLAVWTYGLFDISSGLNELINHLYGPILDPYWPPERKIVESGYKDIQFPFQELNTPSFQMDNEWQLAQLIGYLCTWSAVKKYQAENGTNPVVNLTEKITNLWGDPIQKKLVHWPLILRVWVKNK